MALQEEGAVALGATWAPHPALAIGKVFQDGGRLGVGGTGLREDSAQKGLETAEHLPPCPESSSWAGLP